MGLTEEAAREQAEKDGYKDKLAVVKTSFKANSKVEQHTFLLTLLLMKRESTPCRTFMHALVCNVVVKQEGSRKEKASWKPVLSGV